MKEIVNRLQENRNIERAKQIMESAGYKVTKKSKRLKESKKLKKNKRLNESAEWIAFSDDYNLRAGYAGVQNMDFAFGAYGTDSDGAEFTLILEPTGSQVDWMTPDDKFYCAMADDITTKQEASEFFDDLSSGSIMDVCREWGLDPFEC